MNAPLIYEHTDVPAGMTLREWSIAQYRAAHANDPKGRLQRWLRAFRA